jgi:rod shape-determining protein MreD
MMQEYKHNGSWVIVLSLLIAFMLTAMPLPDEVHNWRPSWVVMVLIYWCMALPNRVGIGVSWLMGILLDVQQGSVFGQNALGLAVIAYITISFYQRLRVFPLLQQAVIVCSYVMIFQLIVLLIKGMTGVPPQTWTFWMPAITSMILWPWLFVILRDVRRKFKVV